MLTDFIIVGTGGFLGSASRFALTQRANRFLPASLPYGTLIVNLLGSFLLGLFFGLDIGSSLHLLFGVGFMGAFTTFSTFNTENIELLKQKKLNTLITYLGISYLGGISLAFFGILIGVS